MRLVNGVIPSQAINLPIMPQSPAIIRSTDSNLGLPKEVILSQVANMDFTESEIDQLYNLSIELKNNSINKEELIGKINNLRGGAFVDIVAALGLIGAIIILSTNAWITPYAFVPPHLQWIYGNQQPGNHFGHGKGTGSRTITVIGLTQNAGSEKKDPSSGSYNYVDVMTQLANQSNKKKMEIQVGNQLYIVKNPSVYYIFYSSTHLSFSQ